MKVLIRSINSYTSEYVGSYLAPTHVRLEAIGLVNGVDYLFNRTDTFIRANDLDKIKELLKEFVLSNCKRKDEFMTKVLRKIDVEIFGMMTYNACKQINKNNQQEVNRLGNNSKGMIIDLTGAHSRFIISKTVDLENKLKAIIKDNDEFTISYFDGFSNSRCDSDVIVIDSLVERDIIKTMFLYNPKIKISS